MLNKEAFFVVGIDPAGIGTTGIVIKTFNAKYARKYVRNIKATNPVEAATKIYDFITDTREDLEEQDCYLKEVIVEVPHGGPEFLKEVKATRELVGILKYQWKEKFRGHLPSHKSKEFLKTLDKKNWSSHIRDAHAIIYAHINEEKFGYSCENWRGNNTNGRG